MNFWKNKKVFITGHTGFKGSWLCLWLSSLGAEITGYALKFSTKPALFNLVGINKLINKSIIADIRDFGRLKKELSASKPEILFHLAAQPLVRESYHDPLTTYSTNVIGTVNLLEAAKSCSSVKAIVNVTTDKVYDPSTELGVKGYGEDDLLGGYDPYSSSKACSEIVSSAYRSSFLQKGPFLATARAGNVIGGGDWASDRLVPDFMRAILSSEKIRIRNPKSTRPWQHVLEPLSGYLILAEKLFQKGAPFAEAWNFGPRENDAKTVEWVVKRLCAEWPGPASFVIDGGKHPHEAKYLKLNWKKAKKRLNWTPKWDLAYALKKVAEWTRVYQAGGDIRQISLAQIKEYSSYHA